jgi:transposase
MVVTDVAPVPASNSAPSALPTKQDAALSAAHAEPAAPNELLRRPPDIRPGSIGLVLPSGVQVSVDSYVNEKALARVLRALRDAL